MMVDRKCPECGAAHRKRGPRDFGAALKASKPVTQEELMRARQKPANCSAVRWRMELRRRANARHYAEFGEVLRR